MVTACAVRSYEKRKFKYENLYLKNSKMRRMVVKRYLFKTRKRERGMILH